jgi:hypothetical protein
MTSLRDNVLTAIGRQLSNAYLPTIQEPLPSELKDLVAQLVALEMRAREDRAPELRLLCVSNRGVNHDNQIHY